MPPGIKKLNLEGYEVVDPARAYLGEGTYGTVFLAKETATGRWVAIKQHHNIAREKGIPSTVMRETSLLKLLKNSPYVVQLLDVKETIRPGEAPVRYMIFEHLDCDLHTYAKHNRFLKPEIVKRITYHVLLGLRHCHCLGVMHRDLKPLNILMDLTNPDLPIAKLCDFGFGRSYMPPVRELTEEIITMWYRPPEVLLGYQGHTPAVDIWSAACILAELHENVTLFQGDSQVQQLINIFRILGTPTAEEWKRLPSCTEWHDFPEFTRLNLKDTMTAMPMDAIDLLDKMLVHDPAKRPSAEECLRHPYFSDIFRESDVSMGTLLPADIFLRIKPPVQTESNPVQLPSQKPPFDGNFRGKSGTF